MRMYQLNVEADFVSYVGLLYAGRAFHQAQNPIAANLVTTLLQVMEDRIGETRLDAFARQLAQLGEAAATHIKEDAAAGENVA